MNAVCSKCARSFETSYEDACTPGVECGACYKGKSAAIRAALTEYAPDQVRVIEQMAGERGLDPVRLTWGELLRLVNEEAAWADQFGAHPHTPDDERAGHREYATALRGIVGRFV